jgi:serine protease AprX
MPPEQPTLGRRTAARAPARKGENVMRRMRPHEEKNSAVRSSAIWTKPDESRSSALWGKGGRGFLASLVAIGALAVPTVAAADSGSDDTLAYMSPGLYEAASAMPRARFNVIVQGVNGETSPEVAREVTSLADGVGVTRRFATLAGVSARLTGRQILKLARDDDILAVTEDAPVVLSGYSNKQQWPNVTGLTYSFELANRGVKAPTIAIVDSGIDKDRLDFDLGSRIVANQVITKLLPNSNGDGRGHGTFVAGIAAGSAPGYAGAAPNANIVMLDVMDDHGMAMTSDVIAAADWIYRNKASKNIRVANFSLHSGVANSFMFDPLDKAVEKLWFSGVVVVAASGNYGLNGQPSGVPFAPGNDPFVITVGASDIGGTIGASDDFNAPWSAYGYTPDGFLKPELAAPGRYMVGPAPVGSTLALERPDRIVEPGYLQLSGTSFAAPLVAGAAAYLLALNPTWTPDQVKGALMYGAKANPNAAQYSMGVGTVFAHGAAQLTTPPNPNLALNRFLVPDPTDSSARSFDAASWASTALADASWASASWSSASWASASWASASWSSASWASASWSSASWASASWASQALADASWASASWASASWASMAYEDNGADDMLETGGYWYEPVDATAALTP